MPLVAGNHRSGQARNHRLAAVFGERDVVDLRQPTQHLQLQTADGDNIDNRYRNQAGNAAPDERSGRQASSPFRSAERALLQAFPTSISPTLPRQTLPRDSALCAIAVPFLDAIMEVAAAKRAQVMDISRERYGYLCACVNVTCQPCLDRPDRDNALSKDFSGDGNAVEFG